MSQDSLPPPQTGMLRGKVKWYNPDSGRGFIKPADGLQDIYFTRADMAPAIDVLNEDDIVDFAMDKRQHRKALLVYLIKRASKSESK